MDTGLITITLTSSSSFPPGHPPWSLWRRASAVCLGRHRWLHPTSRRPPGPGPVLQGFTVPATFACRPRTHGGSVSSTNAFLQPTALARGTGSLSSNPTASQRPREDRPSVLLRPTALKRLFTAPAAPAGTPLLRDGQSSRHCAAASRPQSPLDHGSSSSHAVPAAGDSHQRRLPELLLLHIYPAYQHAAAAIQSSGMGGFACDNA